MYICCGEITMAITFRLMCPQRKLTVAILLALTLRAPLLSAQSSAADVVLLPGRILTNCRSDLLKLTSLRRPSNICNRAS